jgi:hypothetical protein
MVRDVATFSAKRINVVDSKTDGNDENSAGDWTYNDADKTTKPIAILRANKKDIAAPGKGTTSIAKITNTIAGPDNCDIDIFFFIIKFN